MEEIAEGEVREEAFHASCRSQEDGVVTVTLSPKESDSTEVVGTKGHFP